MQCFLTALSSRRIISTEGEKKKKQIFQSWFVIGQVETVEQKAEQNSTLTGVHKMYVILVGVSRGMVNWEGEME